MGSANPHVHFDCARLESVFRRCFAQSENTRLVGGAAEPLYQPASDDQAANLLYFREDYFASALHEIAHWCIAGAERRKQLDFGYWYAAEGRSDEQQRAFESVEIKPQALEWLFSIACGYRFQVSVDNFRADGLLPDTSVFRHSVTEQARRWQVEGLPRRAQLFFDALVEEFGTATSATDLEFDVRDLA